MPIFIKTVKSDKYDRYLADVYFNDSTGESIYLNNLLLEKRLAVKVQSWQYALTLWCLFIKNKRSWKTKDLRNPLEGLLHTTAGTTCTDSFLRGFFHGFPATFAPMRSRRAALIAFVFFWLPTHDEPSFLCFLSLKSGCILCPAKGLSYREKDDSDLLCGKKTWDFFLLFSKNSEKTFEAQRS